MTGPDTKLRLGDWADRCDHPIAASLPRLWADVRVHDRTGWAVVALHWTGSGWATCIAAAWSDDQGGSDQELDESARLALTTASETAHAAWVDTYRIHLHDSLVRARTQLQWEEARLRDRRAQIRELQLATAAATLSDPNAIAIAHRLMDAWRGTPQELVSTAQAAASSPSAGTPGLTSSDD